MADNATPEGEEQGGARAAALSEYIARQAARQRRLDIESRRDLTISHARTGTAVFALLLAWAVFGGKFLSPWWLCVPAAVFVGLMAAHDRALRRKHRAEQAVAFYDQGIRRIEGRWAGHGVVETQFAWADHPNAADLDLFGRGSLFDLLCRARTRAGQQRLAAWLLAPAEPSTVAERQEAARDLRGRLDFREGLALQGEEVHVDPAAILRWGEAPAQLTRSWLRPAAWLLSAAAVVAVLLWWPLGHGPIPLIVVLLAGRALRYLLRKELAQVLGCVSKAAGNLDALSDLLAHLEAAECDAPALKRLMNDLRTDGAPPSARIRRLRALLDWLNLQSSIFFAPIALALLWPVHFAVAIESWRRRSGGRLRRWLEVVAEVEALSSLGSHSFENPDDVFPQVAEPGPRFEARRLAHPLLPIDAAVRNDFSIGGDICLYIVSGSNMSGKSTLLRSIGINTVLALAGAPVRASHMALSPLQVGASLRTLDSLQAGLSRFYAEILRLRQIVELASQSPPLLFLLDEILHGTNSHDRLVGAEAIARSLVSSGAVGLITTHDLALARVTSDPALKAVNAHFEDHLADGKMAFDYQLRPGVVDRSNALELMRAVGLDV